MTHPAFPHVLSIGGSDSGACTGIQADLKTFSALCTYGTTVLTAVTAQNTREVAAIAEVPEEVVIAQIDTVIEDIGVAAIKTGMLSSKRIIVNVVDRLEAWGVPHLVVDPVMMATSGVRLLSADAVDTLRDELLPVASVVTLNISQAEILADHPIASAEDVEHAARRILDLGPKLVVITGGLSAGQPVDRVFDGREVHRLEALPGETEHTLGIGCTFSAAITALLAHGAEPMVAVRLARLYVTNAVRHAFPLGSGHAVPNHFTALPGEIAGRVGAEA